jgi:hypothetical protein
MTPTPAAAALAISVRGSRAVRIESNPLETRSIASAANYASVTRTPRASATEPVVPEPAPSVRIWRGYHAALQHWDPRRPWIAIALDRLGREIEKRQPPDICQVELHLTSLTDE